jgi:addiction module RelE/StbE family toxin
LSVRAIAWTTRAVRRLDLIGAHIAKENPKAAARVVARIVAAVDALAIHPAMGRPGRLTGTREWVVPKLPYLIAYRVTPTTVDVLTVMHAARQWPEKL